MAGLLRSSLLRSARGLTPKVNKKEKTQINLPVTFDIKVSTLNVDVDASTKAAPSNKNPAYIAFKFYSLCEGT